MAKTTDSTGPVNMDRDKYVSTRSASGAKSLSNGDPVAQALEGLDIDQLHTVAKKMTGESWHEKYAHLNIGMQRMNIGNRMRGAVRAIDEANAKAENKTGLVSGIDKLKALTAPLQEKNATVRAKEAEAKAKAKAKAAAAPKEAKAKKTGGKKAA